MGRDVLKVGPAEAYKLIQQHRLALLRHQAFTRVGQLLDAGCQARYGCHLVHRSGFQAVGQEVLRDLLHRGAGLFHGFGGAQLGRHQHRIHRIAILVRFAAQEDIRRPDLADHAGR
ncbi:hypothetical protein SDC9_207239 [bioreactor metagenome]|uniref:Uncharacterized protein n=1 Tax=bioreactor metagenome TaxID=1076179 RepID=A0A645J782_9ZZZZ